MKNGETPPHSHILHSSFGIRNSTFSGGGVPDKPFIPGGDKPEPAITGGLVLPADQVTPTPAGKSPHNDDEQSASQQTPVVPAGKGETLLLIRDLKKYFPVKRGVLARVVANVKAVDGISFAVSRGETLGLVGESGSGKTTVGRCILRLIEPTWGRIEFDGRDITSLPDEQLRPLRHRLQLVFQEPFASLNPRRNVRQTVEEPLLLQGGMSARQRSDRLRETLALVHLGDRHLGRYPNQLTASEQQRVGIARAIVTHPDLVVLDEPTSSLDQTVRAEILDVLVDLQDRLGTAYLFISHDLTAVESVSHRIAIMYLGRIVESGSTQQIFGRQYHPYSRALLSAVL